MEHNSHLEHLDVFQDDLLELLLLFGRVGVVEPQDELALEVIPVVLVQQRSLGVADVKVAATNQEKNESEQARAAARLYFFMLYSNSKQFCISKLKIY